MFYLGFDGRPCVHVPSVANALRQDKLGLSDRTFGDGVTLAGIVGILESRLLRPCHVLSLEN